MHVHVRLYTDDVSVTLRLKIIDEEMCCICLDSVYEDSMAEAAHCFDCKKWICRTCYDNLCGTFGRSRMPCPQCRSHNFILMFPQNWI